MSSEIDEVNINKSRAKFKEACGDIRKLYASKVSGKNEEFVKTSLMNVKKRACIYTERIVPFSNEIVRSIQDYIENYTIMDPDEFGEEIEGLAEEALKQKNEVSYIKVLHMEIQREFKNSSDITETMTEMNEEMKAIKNSIEEINNKFVEALEHMTGFFSILSHELKMLIDNLGLDNVVVKKRHFLKFRNKAHIIIEECKAFIAHSQNCIVDLRATEGVDKNYAMKWSSTTSIEIEDYDHEFEKVKWNEYGKEVSLLTLGGIVLSRNSNSLNLLGVE